VKTIALLAVVAMLLLALGGPRSSVGGPLTIMLVLFIAMLAVGLYEAWLKKRGALGWIVNIVASVVGGFVAASLGSMVMGMILSNLQLEGRSRPRVILCSISHPQA
jgi:uncharacterized membrane protein YeaQ/YmgE (transglycosylase-associated protein family)